MNPILGKFCEECGKPAVLESVHGMIIDRPVLSEQGQWFNCQHIDKSHPNHFRCENHPWKPIVTEGAEFVKWKKWKVKGQLSQNQ